MCVKVWVCLCVNVWVCFLAVFRHCSYFYFEPQVRAPCFIWSVFVLLFLHVNVPAVVHCWVTRRGLGVVKAHMSLAQHEDVWDVEVQLHSFLSSTLDGVIGQL